jgi:hypothetical protein
MRPLYTFTAIAALLLGIGKADAQLPRFDRPSDFDPFNRNSGINQVGRDIDKARLDQMSRTPRAGRDYTRLFIKNGTNARVSVAVRLMPFQWSDGRTSTLQFYEPGSQWSTQAWYILAPGESVYVGNTNNLYYYIYAESNDRRVWNGQHYLNVSDGGSVRNLGFRQEILGIGTPETWTLTLN